jgi:tetratricopeptide (TPR) repeat protein
MPKIRALSDVTIRKLIVSLAVVIIVFGTTAVFHLTQASYKAFSAGENLFRHGHFEEALPFFLTANQIKPRDVKAGIYLARTYKILKFDDKARSVMESLFVSNSKDAAIVLEMGDAYVSIGDFGQAEKLYRSALGLILVSPVRLKTEIRLAEVMAWQKRYEESIAMLEGLYKKHPRNFKVMETLADIYSWSHDYERSIALYEKMISMSPRNRRVMPKIAEVLRYAGRYEESLEVFKRYLSEEAK